MTMAALLATAACSEDKLTPGFAPAISGSTLTLTLTDAGYRPDDTSATRAAENGYATTFTAGDAAGLFAINAAGEVLHANVKVTAADAPDTDIREVVWQLPEGDAGTIKHQNGMRYFLYYPYQEDMTGKVDGSAAGATATASDFFAPLIDEWQPLTDQSDYADYTASDLMVGEGTVGTADADGKVPVDFTLTHCMSLLVLEMPLTRYHITSYHSGQTACDFTFCILPQPVFADGMGMWHTSSESLPNPSPAVTSDPMPYRYLVPAGRDYTLTGQYHDCQEEDDHGFTKAFSAAALKAGQYTVVKIDGGHDLETPAVEGDYHTLGLVRNGDLLCRTSDAQDWYLIPQEVEAELPYGQYLSPDGTVIGVVFQECIKRIGAREQEVLAGMNVPEAHGLALSVKRVYGDYHFIGHEDYYHPNIGSAYSIAEYYREINGLHNTEGWEKLSYATGGPFEVLLKFDETVPRPANTTRWFLPSSGQWWDVAQYLCRNKAMGTKEVQQDTETTIPMSGSSSSILYRESGATVYLNFLTDAVPPVDNDPFFQEYLGMAAASTAWTSTQVYDINNLPDTYRQHTCLMHVSVNGCSPQQSDTWVSEVGSGRECRAALAF